MSLYLKNSLSLTLKELNEAESRICFGISFQALAPWYPKDFLQYSRRSRGISKSSIFLVLYFEIFDLGVNLFLRFSGQSPFLCLKNENIMEGLFSNRKEYTYLYTYIPTYRGRNQECCNNRHYSCTQSKQSMKHLKYL